MTPLKVIPPHPVTPPHLGPSPCTDGPLRTAAPLPRSIRADRPALPGVVAATRGGAGSTGPGTVRHPSGSADADRRPRPSKWTPWAVCAALLVAACAPPVPAPEAPRPPTSDGIVRITLLHLNDVYEIVPVEGGRVGGLARVATLRKRLIERNPNTLTTIGGDFFSPSAMGTARVEGERLAGRQMVAVLNALGLDWATFGNHEFDLDEEAFRARLRESRFGWVSSNVADSSAAPFPGVRPHVVLSVGEPDGDTVRLGLVAATLRSTDPAWVRVDEPLEALGRAAEAVGPRSELLVALTHLRVEQDEAAARVVPDLHLVLGGHEHENVQVWRGAPLTPVLKADANVRTVYVVEVEVPTAGGAPRIEPRLVPVGDALPDDPDTAREVERWVQAAFAGFRASGFDPDRVVARVPEPLDGRESAVRDRETALTALLAEAMLRADPSADVAFYNGGSIRLDDVLPAGPVTEYDVIRILPFGGPVWSVAITGDLLRRVLERGLENRGSGGFLQASGIRHTEAGEWRLADGAPLREDATYRAVTSDFLLTGREVGLDFLTAENPGLTVLQEHDDVRRYVIEEMEARWDEGDGRR